MSSRSRLLIEQAQQLPVLERLEVEDRLAAYRSGEIKAVDLENVLAKYRKP